jgi:hypothetical protein
MGCPLKNYLFVCPMPLCETFEPKLQGFLKCLPLTYSSFSSTVHILNIKISHCQTLSLENGSPHLKSLSYSRPWTYRSGRKSSLPSRPKKNNFHISFNSPFIHCVIPCITSKQSINKPRGIR